MTEPTRWTARRRLIGVLVATIAILLFTGIVLTRPVGPTLAPETEHIGSSSALPPLTDPGDRFTQSFTATQDGLAAVEVRFGRFNTKQCSIQAQLIVSGDIVLNDRRLQCADIPDAVPYRLFQFAPITDSARRTFEVSITLVDRVDGGITLFGAPATDAFPEAARDNAPTQLSAEVHSYYGTEERVVDVVGKVLRRLDQFGPWWQGGIAVVVLAVLLAAIGIAIASGPRARRVELALIIALALVKGMLWSAVIPPLQGPDEPAHYAYAQFLDVDHRIPKRGHNVSGLEGFSDELVSASALTHPKAAVPGDRPDYGVGHSGADEAQLDQPLNEHAGGDGPAAGYSPVYYAVPAALDAIAPGTLVDRLQLLRVWSVLLGVATAIAAWFLGRRLFPASAGAALALGAGAALQPMLSHQTAIVSNDALVIAAGAWCLVVAVDLTRPGRSRWLPLVAGLLAGTAALAKPFGLAWVPILLFAWAVGRRRGARDHPWFQDLGLAGVGLVATYGVWWAFSIVFGYPGVGIGQEPVTTHRSFADFVHLLSKDWLAKIRLHWIDQFWGNFGNVNTPYPTWVEGVILVVVLLGIALVGVWAVRVLRDRDRLASDTDVAALVFVVAIGFTIVALYVLLWDYFRRVGALDLIQGRYGLMLVPAVLALPALCVRRIIPRLEPTIPLVTAAGAMAVLNVFGLCQLLAHYYV